MTTSNDFAGAVLILADPSAAEDTAAWVRATYFPNSEFHYTLTDGIPSTLPQSIQEDTATKRNPLGEGSHVLTVYPWAQAEATNALTERPTHGKIPS